MYLNGHKYKYNLSSIQTKLVTISDDLPQQVQPSVHQEMQRCSSSRVQDNVLQQLLGIVLS